MISNRFFAAFSPQRGFMSLLAMALVMVSTMLLPVRAQAATINCSTATCLTGALSNAQPGDVINLAAGVTFTGSFKAYADGTSSAPITLQSESAANKAILSGSGTNTGYALHMTGNHWIIRDLKITNAKKGVMIDNANYTLIDGAEIYNIGEEGVHYRDGSSYNIIENSIISNCGLHTAGYGEGVYVGSDVGKWGEFIKETDHNIIRNNTIGPGVTAESIDIKEGATGTIVEYNTFNGTGITGANTADSFMDVKGNNSIIRYNIAYRNNNTNINDAFQLNERSPGWGFNNEFYGNTVYMDISTGYVVNVKNGSAIVCDNTRSPAGNMYLGNYTECSGPSPSTTTHIADIVMGFGSGGGQTWATATVLVKDNNGNAVANATVDGQWSGMTADFDSGATGADGKVTVQSNKVSNPGKGTYAFTVYGVAHASLTYDSILNVMTSNSVTK